MGKESPRGEKEMPVERSRPIRKEEPRHIMGPKDPTEAMIKGVAEARGWTEEKAAEWVRNQMRQANKKETGESPQY